jgi:hypothetical protein
VGTFVDGGLPSAGRYLGSSDCADWTTANASNYGIELDAVTAARTSVSCSLSRVIACCM